PPCETSTPKRVRNSFIVSMEKLTPVIPQSVSLRSPPSAEGGPQPSLTLMLAADRKDLELLKILLERRVDRNAQDALGRTALHSAVRVKASDCFELLLEANVDKSLRTVEGKTPAIFAAEFGRARIFQNLLAHHLTMPEWELRAAHSIAARNEKHYKKVRADYGREGVELGGRSAFKEIITACSKRLGDDAESCRSKP
ncbi:ankyrin repeat domain-containing protein, partial [Cribrihabitans sp. XS_ASV171]